MQSNFFIVFTLNEKFAGNMYVNENMLFSDIVKTFNYYYPLKSEDEERSFYLESKPIKLDSNLKDIGVKNMSIINIKTGNTPKNKLEETPANTPGDNNAQNFINVIFITPEKSITIQTTKETKFSELVKKFCLKIGCAIENPMFICNSQKIDSDERKTLEDLHIKFNSKINVVYTYQIIGA